MALIPILEIYSIILEIHLFLSHSNFSKNEYDFLLDYFSYMLFRVFTQTYRRSFHFMLDQSN
jgi:hypothetical protein